MHAPQLYRTPGFRCLNSSAARGMVVYKFQAVPRGRLGCPSSYRRDEHRGEISGGANHIDSEVERPAQYSASPEPNQRNCVAIADQDALETERKASQTPKVEGVER